MKVETKAVAKKLIMIAIAQQLVACSVEPKHFEKLTQQDKQELARLLNADRSR